MNKKIVKKSKACQCQPDEDAIKNFVDLIRQLAKKPTAGGRYPLSQPIIEEPQDSDNMDGEVVVRGGPRLTKKRKRMNCIEECKEAYPKSEHNIKSEKLKDRNDVFGSRVKELSLQWKKMTKAEKNAYADPNYKTPWNSFLSKNLSL